VNHNAHIRTSRLGENITVNLLSILVLAKRNKKKQNIAK